MAFLPLDGRLPRDPDRCRHRDRRRPARRPLRPPVVGEARGPVRALPPFPLPSALTLDRFTFPLHRRPGASRNGWPCPVSVLWIVGADEHGQLRRRDGRPGRRDLRRSRGRRSPIIALSLGKPEAAVLSAIVAGACFGFLRHNFYPARIFMGDSGAMLLGFTLAAVSIQGLLKTAATVALFVPLLALAIPIIDTSFVVAKRLKYRLPVYQADALAPASPLRRHRLLPAPRGALPLGLVHDPRRRRARDPLRPVPGARSLEPLADSSSSARSGSWRSRRRVYIVIAARDPEAPPHSGWGIWRREAEAPPGTQELRDRCYGTKSAAKSATFSLTSGFRLSRSSGVGKLASAR